MKKLIESSEITIENRHFKVEYISENDTYVITPDVYDKDFDENKILKALETENKYKIHKLSPEKTDGSEAIIKKGYIISKPHNKD